MRLVVIEAPYRENPAAMKEYLAACVRDCLTRGESPTASVAVFCLTGALDDAKAAERKQGIESGLHWYAVADACVCYSDHGISAGMMLGMEAARVAGVPIEIRELFKGEA